MRGDLSGARVDYASTGDGGTLDETTAPASPYDLFEAWYADARAALEEPNAMVLATVGADGYPSSRTVLLKDLSTDGLVFFTNYSSRKGQELSRHPACALLFPWYPLHRQVRVEGAATRVDPEESRAYFATRPRDAQLGAWASAQSRPLGSRAELEESLAEATARFAGDEVPCPPHWGGFRVAPASFEFWQGRHGRLHDRLRYLAEGAGWRRERLAP